MKPIATISGYGITTSIGGNTAQSCAALRAGLVRFEPTDLHYCFGFDPEKGELEKPTVATIAGLDPRSSGLARWLALALPAFAEAIVAAQITRAELEKSSLHLAFPDRGRPATETLDETFAQELARRGAFPAPAQITVARGGNSGIVECIEKAMEFLAAGAEHAIVLCVDSLAGGETLRWLDRMDRLKCSRAPEGVVAGEAAAAIVFSKKGIPRAHLVSLGRAKEANTVSSEGACTGEGLTKAVRAAAAPLPPATAPTWVIIDLNGERYRALEWGYTLTRAHELLPGVRHTWTIAEALGDVGAATGGIAIARACAAFERGYAPADRAWILLGSDEGGRAALVLAPPLSREAPRTP